MSQALFRQSVPVFIRMLSNLKSMLAKAKTYAQDKKVDESVLLQARLFPDMFPLVRQVQIAGDFAKGAGARLAGVEVPKYEDNETSFDELIARLARTIDFLSGLKAEQFEGCAERVITLPFRPDQPMKGEVYLIDFAIPNFYFHVTTAYALLRHNGLAIGKQDFVGEI
ncbi:MAG: DUF1993 domain-containing protein [Gammaproteobacteria bacterium]|nr:DUF1993 domain-containing protein [Gammaproteobacteria bacterium]